MKNRKLFVCIAIVAIIGTYSVSVVAANPITIKINGKLIQSEVPPQIIEGRTMVPLRMVAQELGAKVDWDDVNSTVLISSSVSPTSNDVSQIKLIGRIASNYAMLWSISKSVCSIEYELHLALCDMDAKDSTKTLSNTKQEINEVKNMVNLEAESVDRLLADAIQGGFDLSGMVNSIQDLKSAITAYNEAADSLEKYYSKDSWADYSKYSNAVDSGLSRSKKAYEETRNGYFKYNDMLQEY